MALGNGGLGSGGVLDTLMHTGLLDSLNRFYPTVCTMQELTQARRPNGELVNEWTAVSGLAGLRGNFAGAAAAEKRGAVLTVQTATHVLDLQGYYPDVVVTMRAMVYTAVINGLAKAFNIAAVVHDSQSQQTRLELEEVKH